MLADPGEGGVARCIQLSPRHERWSHPRTCVRTPIRAAGADLNAWRCQAGVAALLYGTAPGRTGRWRDALLRLAAQRGAAALHPPGRNPTPRHARAGAAAAPVLLPRPAGAAGWAGAVQVERGHMFLMRPEDGDAVHALVTDGHMSAVVGRDGAPLQCHHPHPLRMAGGSMVSANRFWGLRARCSSLLAVARRVPAPRGRGLRGNWQ